MKKVVVHVKKGRRGFNFGYTPLIGDNTGLEFGILKIKKEWYQRDPRHETCLVLLKGKGQFGVREEYQKVERNSIFDENPFCLLIPPGIGYKVVPEKEMELATIKVSSFSSFNPVFFTPKEIQVEKRGKGLMDDTAYRLVKTIFDYSNMPESNLVVGEVVTLPGRWSSYPPHHHPQPEIYFYRFWPETGFGFAQLGERVLKVRHNDLVKILNGVTHPQVAAPGYVMWYLWVIRHLPNNPYIGFEFEREHHWLLDQNAKIWKPK